MFVHEVMRHAIQTTKYETYGDLVVDPTTKRYGHQYYFFDTEEEATQFVLDNPRKQYTYQYREWDEPYISECFVNDYRKIL